MQLKPLTLGPIVGATTPTSVRLWGRGDLELMNGRPRWCYGVAQLRKPRGRKFLLRQLVKLSPHFDMTGVAVFTGLEPDTRYDYQFAYFFSDVEVKGDLFSGEPWPTIDIQSFTTASADPQATRNMVVGSCRYLLSLFGEKVFDDRGDKAFRSISNLIQQKKAAGEETHQLLLVGDQIYADDLRSLEPAVTLEQFFQRYHDAFGQPHIRGLMAGLPCYMILDDHEVEDDWPNKASEKDWLYKWTAAMQAYLCYQASHGPLFDLSDQNRITGIPDHFWYTYRDGCCDFFVSDTRTERVLDEDGREIMSEEQLGALKQWLIRDQDRVKVIVSTVPFIPDIKGNNKHWGGFQEQRAELLDWIVENHVRKILFISGDIHLSMSAEMVSEEKPDIKIVSVISSALFWPIPRNPFRKILAPGTIHSKSRGSFRVSRGLEPCKRNNFVRLSISPQGVSVEIYRRKGQRESATTHHF